MGKRTPTQLEVILVNELAYQLRAIPEARIRFACRIQEPPGRHGLLFGVELPSSVRCNGYQVFQLHNYCITLGKQHNMPIGLSVAEYPPLWQESLDLRFLPEDIISKSTNTIGMVIVQNALAAMMPIVHILRRGYSSFMAAQSDTLDNRMRTLSRNIEIIDDSYADQQRSMQEEDVISHEEVLPSDHDELPKFDDLFSKQTIEEKKK